MSEQMTKVEAQEYIPQWGSYIGAGDPGAIAYTAIPPDDKETRDSLVSYLETCKTICEQESGIQGDEYEYSDYEQLERAIEYLQSLSYSDKAARLIIQICPNEPSAYICGMNGESVAQDPDLADCRASGDVQPACEYVRDRLGVEFRIVARNAQGEYENRLATDSELEATARQIYFDSESDFADSDTAKMYLIWEAASHCHLEGEE